MRVLFESLVCILIIFLGIIEIYGTNKKWPMLVDPPKKFSHVYSHSLLKKYFGQKFLIFYNYFLGFSFISFGCYGLWLVIN